MASLLPANEIAVATDFEKSCAASFTLLAHRTCTI